MTKKQGIEVAFAIALILALVGVLWWMFVHDKQQDLGKDPGDEDGAIEVPDASTEPIAHDLPKDAVTIARIFVERFGSFSNHSEYENISSVSSLCTPEMALQLESLREEALEDASRVYYGISTRVLSLTQVEAEAQREVLDALTQRQESIESPANTTVKYQTMRVTLLKNGENWLIDSFVWLE